MNMGFSTHKHIDSWADDEDPSQLIIRPEWDAPHVRCFPRVFCAWPCLLRQVGTALGSVCDCTVTGITYANSGSRHLSGGVRRSILVLNVLYIFGTVWRGFVSNFMRFRLRRVGKRSDPLGIVAGVSPVTY